MRKVNFKKAGIWGLVAVMLLCGACLFFAACSPKASKLSTPTTLTVEGNLLSWQAVNGAKKYEVTINGKKVTSSFTRTELYNRYNRAEDGKYLISVIALPTDERKSLPSDPARLEYMVSSSQMVTPSILGFEYNTITFSAVSEADEYLISYKEQKEEEYTTERTKNTFFSIDALADGVYSLQISAAGDGIYFTDSQVNDLEVEKKATEKSVLRLPSPKEATVSGTILTWKDNLNVANYFLTDMYGNVSVAPLCEYDLEQRQLIYTIQAMSSVQAIENSKPSAPVQYLLGSGTKSEPYQISQPFDFRAINYYEQKYKNETGEYDKRYYRLEQDIIFPELTENQKMNFYMIELLQGEVDGNGKYISNIKVEYDAGEYALFGEVLRGGMIHNLTVKDSVIRTIRRIDGDGNYKPNGSQSAVVCIKNYGIIDNITVQNTIVESMGICAPIALFNYNGIQNIKIKGVKVKVLYPPKGAIPKHEASGVVVNNSGQVFKCNIDSSTQVEGYRTIGGICSINRGDISACTIATNKITAKADTSKELGWLIGYNAGNYSSDCTYTASGELPMLGGSI